MNITFTTSPQSHKTMTIIRANWVYAHVRATQVINKMEQKVNITIDVSDANWVKAVIIYAAIDYKRASYIYNEITEQINEQLK